jgi:hypothetical protein
MSGREGLAPRTFPSNVVNRGRSTESYPHGRCCSIPDEPIRSQRLLHKA